MTGPVRRQRVAESTADALRRGDPRAFEELYVLLRGEVYNLAARIVGDRGEAEDITQEVFLRAFRHLPGKTDQARPEAWVFRTTVNACYDHLRRRAPATVALANDHDLAAGDGFEQSATAAAVEKALGDLNPRYRTALVLKDLHGLGNAEIAEVMGIARSTVGVLLFRARRAFGRRYRQVAPTLGAGLPVVGLAVWLPPLPVPASLMSSPTFLAPLAAVPATPSAVAPLVPVAATVTPTAAVGPPAAAGLAKLATALTTKVALVALTMTAAVGGAIAVDHVRSTGPGRDVMAASTPVSPADTWGRDVSDRAPRTHGTGPATSRLTSGEGDGSSGSMSGTATRRRDGGTATRDGGGTGSDGGTKTRTGSGGTQGGGAHYGSGAGSGADSGPGGGADSGAGPQADGTRGGRSPNGDAGAPADDGTVTGRSGGARASADDARDTHPPAS